jgi:cyanophycin synthetase
MLREGLAFDRCDVAVVTNIGSGDHLGLNYITTVEDLAVLKRVIVKNISAQGFAVLNATDPAAVAMAKHCPGSVVYFAMSPQNPVVAAHLAQGQRAVYVECGCLVAAQGAQRVTIPMSGVPITRNGTIGFQVENVMASLAAAWALNVDWNAVKAGLASFENDSHNAIGRFNVFEFHGATVIADYGHNPDAMMALVQAVNNLPGKQRSVVISGAGDRRDEDIRQQTQILGQAFDDVVLYQDQCQRGRSDGEVIALLREGLKGATRTKNISEITGEFLAIDTAMNRLHAGDLCLILVDQVEEALKHIRGRISAQ